VSWREANKLSQRQVVAVMAARDYPVNLKTLQGWEQGWYAPEPLAAKALETFLAQYPTVNDAPVYGKKSKLSAQDLAEIRRLRDEGQSLTAIAARFGVDVSYISRIVSGERLKKASP
jgi:transcriptional regulator with XRE-family HTH domain